MRNYCYISGDAEYHVEGSVYPLVPGSMLIMRPGEAHCVRILGPGRYERYAVNFPVDIFDSFDPDRILLRPFTERGLGKRNLYIFKDQEQAFAEISREAADRYARDVLIRVRLLGFVDMIRREYERSAASACEPETTAAKAVAYVNSHLFDDLTVEKLSARFFLSKSQFGRVFKQATGAPPWDYIIAKRLLAAKTMIAEGASARYASERCGFGDYSAFYRAYVKRFGHSPGKDGIS